MALINVSSANVGGLMVEESLHCYKTDLCKNIKSFSSFTDMSSNIIRQ